MQQICNNLSSIFSLETSDEQMEIRLLKKEQSAQMVQEHVNEKMSGKLKQLFYIYRKLHKDNLNEQMVSFLNGIDRVSNDDNDIRVV